MIDVIKKIFKKNGVDRTVYLAVLVLTIVGIVMIGSAAVGLSAKNGSTYATKSMIKQCIFVLIGYCGMIFVARTFKIKYINEHTVFILYGVVLFLMCICRIWTDSNGSYSWIKLPGGLTIQPMEFMKIVIILFLAHFFGEVPDKKYSLSNDMSKEMRNKITNQKIIYSFAVPMVAIFIAFIIGILLQNDLGSSLVLLSICIAIFYCNPLRYYSRWKKIGICLFVFVFVFALLFKDQIFQAHQLARFSIWLDPISSENYYNNGFQFANGLIAYATGGLFGKGFGASTQKFGYIPEASNDFISAIIVEELGVIGFFVLVIIPYCIIIIKLFLYGIKVKEVNNKLILYGISAYFFAHLLVNVGGVSGLIPMTGVPLLMVSSGGSSTIASMIAIGIAQAIIAKYNKDKLKEQL